MAVIKVKFASVLFFFSVLLNFSAMNTVHISLPLAVDKKLQTIVIQYQHLKFFLTSYGLNVALLSRLSHMQFKRGEKEAGRTGQGQEGRCESGSDLGHIVRACLNE